MRRSTGATIATGWGLILALGMMALSLAAAPAAGQEVPYSRPVDMAELVEKSGVRQLALYHLIPAPQNALVEKVFVRDLPPGTIITEDRMVFELPAGSDAIDVTGP